MGQNAKKLIQHLGLKPHPEGGYYKEIYRSDLYFDARKVSDRFPGPRCCSTSIYYLLNDLDFSAFHRIKADEIWHFYSGSTLIVHVITPEGVYHPIHLGPNTEKGQVFQAMVPSGCWFASALESGSGYALTGCTTAPGFEFEDFEMGHRDELSKTFPHLSELINRYTR